MPRMSELDEGLEPAGFRVRAGAFLIDYAVIIVLMIVGAFMCAFAATVLGNPAFVDAMDKDVKGLDWFTGTLTLIAYHTIFVATTGSSIGKRLVGLQVVSMTPGVRVTFGDALARSAAMIVDGFFFGLVAYNTMSKSPEKQRLGDEWADTRVVHRRSLAPHLRTHGFTMLAGTIAAVCVTFMCGVLQVTLQYWLTKK